MKKSLFVLALFAWPVFLMPAQAQKKGTTSVDVRIVQNRPNVFISYEQVGKREPQDVGDSDEGVWLRFHNNSKWQVGVCMFEVSKENGDMGFNYEVERYENAGSEEVPIASDPEGSCSIGLIKSGKSLVFSLPREHMAEGLAIKVRFRYEWESDTNIIAGGGREPLHYAYFYSLDIPKK